MRILLLLVLLLSVGGCEHMFPAAPVTLPPCQMIAMVDQNGNVIGYYVNPAHYVGTFLNCDLKNKVYP
jgi:hypothetical protein